MLSGVQSHEAPAFDPSSTPKPLPLSNIHLPIDTDTTNRPLGKKIADARAKKYNHIIVVGKRDVESAGMNMQIVNQPGEEAALSALEEALGHQLSDADRSKKQSSIDLKGARSYFENLVTSYL